MKRSLLVALGLIIGLGAASCGGEMKEAAEAMSAMKDIAASADEAKESMDVLEKRRKEREERGDTLAMPAEELMTYLPSSVDGYEPKEPEYESMETAGMSMTTVKQTFEGPDGKRVRVSLVDYNASMFGYMGAAAMFRLNIKQDNNRERSGTFQTDNELINGYEKFNKRDSSATVTYGIGGRFLLTINARKQAGTEFAKSVAESMKLDKLAEM